MRRATSTLAILVSSAFFAACSASSPPAEPSSPTIPSESASNSPSVATTGLPGGAEKTSKITLASIQPDDGIKSVTDAIEGASKTIDIAVYQADPDYSVLVAALNRAQQRGVKVRMLLSATIYPPSEPNSNPAYAQTFTDLGIPTKLSDPQFSYAHWKVIIIDAGTDRARAMICDFNLEDGYFGISSEYPNEGTTRGMSVWDTDADDVALIAKTFESDWPPFRDWPKSERPNLVWSPSEPTFQPAGNSQTALTRLITGARTSLDIYAQELAKPSVLLQPLLDALGRGVAVRIVGNDGGINSDAQAELLKAGAQIVVNPTDPDGDDRVMYIHTKTIVADVNTDHPVAYVGSINPFLDMSLQTERELGAFVTDRDSVAKMDSVFVRDFTSGERQ